MADKPAEAVRAKPDSSLVAAVRAVAAATPTRSSPPGTPARCSPPASSTCGACRACCGPRSRCRSRPATASVLLDAGANAERAPEHSCSSRTWARSSARSCSGSRDPEVRLLSIGEEDEKGNQLTLEAHRLLREDDAAQLRGQRREPRPAARRRRRRRHRRLHRQHRAQAARGDDQGAARRAARRDHRDARGKLGGLLIRPAARRLRTRLDPDTYGGAYLLGLRGLAVIAHGNSGRTAIANAIRLAARGVEQRVVERLAERLPERVRV